MEDRPLTALIVDDEPLARQELAYLLDRAGGIQTVGQGSNGVEAIDLVQRLRPEVLFLDVQMPVLDGFAVLKKLLAGGHTPMPHLVFATAFDRYAVKAFEVNAVDYLLKPFDEKRVRTTVERLHTLRSSETPLETRVASEIPTLNSPAAIQLGELLRMLSDSQVEAPSRSGKVIVRSAGRLILVDQQDVCFAATAEGSIRVVTKTMEGEAHARTLDELQEQLSSHEFWRAHRGYLVNIRHIREVVPWFKSSYQLRMDDRHSTEIPVSRTQTKRLRDLFNL